MLGTDFFDHNGVVFYEVPADDNSATIRTEGLYGSGQSASVWFYSSAGVSPVGGVGAIGGRIGPDSIVMELGEFAAIGAIVFKNDLWLFCGVIVIESIKDSGHLFAAAETGSLYMIGQGLVKMLVAQ